MTTKKNGIATDSILLMFVRCITMLVGIVQTMILSREFSLYDYGTYSQGLLIISFTSPFLSLGLQDAVNYFFNKDENLRERNIDNIFTFSFLSGLFGALIISLFREKIAEYLSNPQITTLCLYVAFRPCLVNLIGLYQTLYISLKKANIIAFRNFFISILQIITVYLSAHYIKNIFILFALLLSLDILQLFFFDVYLRIKGVVIHYFYINASLIKQIIIFAFPMLLATSIGTVNLNIDKLMISNMMDVEAYALYSNMSKELPFAFIAQSMTTVVTPSVVKLLGKGEIERFRKLWSDYLQFGYTVSWPLSIGAFFFAPEIIEFLYSSTYLSDVGIAIFRIYLISTMLRFTYFGLVPTALGKTDIVLRYSVYGMLINIALNYILYNAIGICGPAYATVISMVVPTFFYFHKSIKETCSNFWEIIKIKEIIKIVLISLLMGFVFSEFYRVFLSKIITANICGLFMYATCSLSVLLLNFKSIRRLVERLNSKYE